MERERLKVIKEVDILKLKRREKWLIYAFGIVLFLLAFDLGRSLGVPMLKYPTSLLPLIAVAPLIVLHELAHGLSFKAFGGKMKFGFLKQHIWDMMFYTTSPGSILPRRKMNLVVLSPQIMTMAIFIILPFVENAILGNCLLVFAALNLAGGCGDIYITLLIAKQKGRIFIEDTGTGAVIYKEEEVESHDLVS